MTFREIKNGHWTKFTVKSFIATWQHFKQKNNQLSKFKGNTILSNEQQKCSLLVLFLNNKSSLIIKHKIRL